MVLKNSIRVALPSGGNDIENRTILGILDWSQELQDESHISLMPQVADSNHCGCIPVIRAQFSVITRGE
ncbi:hypothetical protein OPV22_019546 [Ensete ventricosum]|uniref:Uncharacterized protein n=1 Tax=Ensete ventricosum TaxID=4639 RepID=A0AAV8Q7W1_ENSVE|nr:hypothetical protein OPV22_019546 [Ensete ventricosum]